MIIRLLLAAAALYVIYRLVKIAQSKPPDQRRPFYMTLIIASAAAGLVVLSLTGKVHWIAGLIGAAAPFVRQFIVNHLQQRLSAQSAQGQQGERGTPDRGNTMSRADALAVLGLKEGASEDEIIRAHRQLMQKLHPDRGGNDYLASQLNAAKTALLGD